VEVVVALQTAGSSTPLGLPMSAINSRIRPVSSVRPSSAGIYPEYECVSDYFDNYYCRNYRVY